MANAKGLRRLTRVIHLVGAGAIGTYVYAAWYADPTFRLTIQICVIPILTLTGLTLWQQAWVMRRLRGVPN